MKNFYGNVEYQMSVNMANAILDNRNKADMKITPNEYLCKIVNQEFGIKGNCVNVILV